jgi:uncharacterized protein (DUF1501 family)
MHESPLTRHSIPRREALRRTALGFGSVALAGLCAEQAASTPAARHSPATHLAPRAKRVIMLFMQGGQSQIDLFDPKPELNRRDGQFVSGNQGLKYKGSPFRFAPRGDSGLEVSLLFPHLAAHADKLCMVRSMITDTGNHSNAMLLFHTGSQTLVRPSVGSWVAYGLGAENRSLPSFITIRPTRGHGARVHSSAFLPLEFQATPVGHDGVSAAQATISNLTNSKWSPRQQRAQMALRNALNERFHEQVHPAPQMEGLIRSYETAFRMQTAAPGLFDLSNEPRHVLDSYGVDQPETDTVGRMCLLARRFAEAGVRFVQVNQGAWDHHGSINASLPRTCQSIDRPIAALLADLQQRGMLEDTLVINSGEFGRTATAEGEGAAAGRNHNANAFTLWMAGGGVRGGMAHGVTDPLGERAVENQVHIHDLHATLLYLLGIDHELLTYHYGGRDFRLTDVFGNVVKEIVV